MKRTIQVRISKGERQFVAECLDLPVVTQAPSLDELAVNIREAIGLHLEGEDLGAMGIENNPRSSRPWRWKPSPDAKTTNAVRAILGDFGFQPLSQRGAT